MAKSHLASRLTLLVVAFAGLFLIFGATTWYTIQQVRVQGPIYEQIVSGKDLIADILPPPEYIIEAYLVARELNDETDPTRISELVDRGDKLRVDYESRQEFWKHELPQNSIKDLMTVTAYRSAMQFFQLRDEQFIPAIRAGDHEKARAVLAQMQRVYEVHRLAIDQVVQQATLQNDAFESQSKTVIANRSAVLVGLATAILLVVGFMALYAHRSAHDLSARIKLASEIANRVASGDLATEVPKSDRDDEAGQLLTAIQKMTASLRGLVTRAKQASIELMSTATEFAATSRQQEATVQSFGASTNQIAAAVKQISATSAELLTTMEGVNTVAGQTADMAEDGQAGLRNLDSTMERLAGAANTMAARLAAIREEAAEITGVVTTISKVADQTNLLSINAAIEAEKAGEQGLGFLVLAREIRRLADQTAVATLDIEQMVKQMQTAVSAGVMEIDRFAEEVKSGVGNVERVGGQFGQIITQVKTLSERFDAVNHGMRSQSQGAGQIGDAMGQMIDGARQTSVSLREFNSATESLRDAVAVLKQEIALFQVGS
ncbi:MAG TPA: methyl-accepting chemotaxis protein [Xanthomonadaceae bacterium]|jgi:methyl-accepting chemotaxis protein WspA